MHSVGSDETNVRPKLTDRRPVLLMTDRLNISIGSLFYLFVIVCRHVDQKDGSNQDWQLDDDIPSPDLRKARFNIADNSGDRHDQHCWDLVRE